MDPYASHLPVLRFLADHIPIRSVLEIGAGHYSTPCFLDPLIFPRLKRLVTIEEQLEWANLIEKTYIDPRLAVFFAGDGNLWSVLGSHILYHFSLIFIDNGGEEQRAETIRYISRRNIGKAVVVIHDWEIESYQQAAKGFRHRMVFADETPQTAILWQDN